MQPVSTWLASACLVPTRTCSARHFHGADLSARSCFQTIRDRCLVPKSVTNHLDEYKDLCFSEKVLQCACQGDAKRRGPRTRASCLDSAHLGRQTKCEPVPSPCLILF